MSNTIGERIRTTIFGQSHSPAIGCVIEGLPPWFAVDWEAVQAWLDRRAPGRDSISTARREGDAARVLSGLNERGETCGAPLCVMIDNAAARSSDYAALVNRPRPGHADYPAHVKTGGARDPRGGGEFSGRLTAPLCVAGAIAAQLLARRGIRTGVRVAACAGVEDEPRKLQHIDDAALDALAGQPFPTFSRDACARMRAAILGAASDMDSVGGVIEAYALNVPPGWGEPMFGGLENAIARMVFGIPAVRGIAFGAGEGSGFAAAGLRGSEHNDSYYYDETGTIRTRTNRHGGILGGISTGMPIVFEAAIKPTPSVGLPQHTVDLCTGEDVVIEIRGRHDPCIVQRAAPVVEAALALVLADAGMGCYQSI